MPLKFYDSPFDAIEEPIEASKSILKADLTIMIRDIIEQECWTQKEAALKLGVTQPRIWELVNGKIDKFTFDVLICMLETLGFRADFISSNSQEASITISIR